jgi:hypothetical protein
MSQARPEDHRTRFRRPLGHGKANLPPEDQG